MKKWILYTVAAFFIAAGIIAIFIPIIELNAGEAKSQKEIEALMFQISKNSVDNKDNSSINKGDTEASPDNAGGEQQGIVELPPNTIGYIKIEAIEVEYIILEGAGKSQLAYHIGHVPESSGIGAGGNCALAGHTGSRIGKFFRDIPKLKNGDIVVVGDLLGNVFTYTVNESFVVEGTDVEILEENGEDKLTLITCTDGGKKRRIVVCQRA